MISFTCRYAKVYEPRINLNISECKVFANLSTSRKDNRTDPVSYIRSVWNNVAFVGEAFEPAKALRGGEVIDVIRGAITNEKASNGKTYTNLIVFEFTLSDIPNNNIETE